MPIIRVLSGESKTNEAAVESRAAIGRASECDIVLSDPRAGRKHAEIVERGGGWIIRDLGSSNGTFLDGNRVKEAELSHGAKIGVADAVMVFLTQDVDPQGSGESPTIIDDSSASACKAINSEAQTSTMAVAAQDSREKMLRAVQAIENVSHAVHSARSPRDLFGNVARSIMAAYTDCDCCHVLAWDTDTHRLIPMASEGRSDAGTDRLSFSTTAIQRTMHQKQALLCTSVFAQPDLKEAVSVQSLGIKSFICAPILREGLPRGIIYMDSRRSRSAFCEADLSVLCVIGHEAGLALENADLCERLKMEGDDLRGENRDLKVELSGALSAGSIVGTSPAIRSALDEVRKVAAFPKIPILLTGETGTGKELFARAVHDNSPRRDGPYLVINCPTLPRELTESELFGHKAGAFTSASEDRTGKLELADGGTAFLDEITEMSIEAQSKLLRVLQDGEFSRVGDNEVRKTDIRIVAATNRNVQKAIRDGSFREDLYHRLAGIQVSLPKLCERGDDIVMLAEHFLQQFAAENHVRLTGFTDDAKAAMLSYEWPGNVRELRQVVQTAAVMAHGRELIELPDLPPHLVAAGGQPVTERPTTLDEAIDGLAKEMIGDALTELKGNIVQAADRLGLSQQGLRNKIEKHGLTEHLDVARQND